jgi:hypothetical protein
VSVICYFISTFHITCKFDRSAYGKGSTTPGPRTPGFRIRAPDSNMPAPCLAMMDAQPNTMYVAKNHSRPPDATRSSSCHHGLRRRGHLPAAFPSALSSLMQCPCCLSHGVYSGRLFVLLHQSHGVYTYMTFNSISLCTVAVLFSIATFRLTQLLCFEH